MNQPSTPRVVIVGGGFGGLNAAQALSRAAVDIVLIDRSNHHLFQPLLYQVATASLSPADIATPIRKVLRNQSNAKVILAEAEAIDTGRRVVLTDQGEVAFDYLILAAGATHSYFANSGWAGFAPGLKTIDDATEIRRRFLLAFEAAELEDDPQARRAELTFVVVGAGPTGVELAGAISEVARRSMPRDFRLIDTTTARIILIEAADRVLPGMDERCSGDALQALRSLHVEVMLGARVTEIDDRGVNVGSERIDAGNVLWAAGIQASPLGQSLGVELDRVGRVVVGPDLTIPGCDNVFVIGDQAHGTDSELGTLLPGVAQVAVQGGCYAAKVIADEVEARAAGARPPGRGPFHYRDKGTLATIGRNKAVADLHGLKLRGFPAWFLWALVHIMFLISFRNRVAVMTSWLWSYLFFDRSARLITGSKRAKVKRSILLGPD